MKKTILPCFLLLVGFTLASCQTLDVVGTSAVNSFQKVLAAIPESVAADADIGGWALTSPDGTTRFLWSQDFSQDAIYDAWLETQIDPFLEAGLDTGKLPEGMVHEGFLILGVDFGNQTYAYKGEVTPLSSMEQIAVHHRQSIGYHKALDHYGVDLTGGNMFEWAKNLETNDKDIVFVLDPQPFIAAGVDPENVPGWLYAQVEIMDGNGKPILADKLLKPFDID